MARRAVMGQVGQWILLSFVGWLLACGWAFAAPEAGAWQTTVVNFDGELRKSVATPDRGPSADQIDRLISDLDDNSYPARTAAAEKLTAWFQDPALAREIGDRLKHHLRDMTLGFGARKSMDTLWKRARGSWLLADAPLEPLKPVSDEQLNVWLDDLIIPVPSVRARALQAQETVENARRELLDLLACDAQVPRVKAAIAKRLEAADLEATHDDIVLDRLQELFDLTRPAMIAEFWQKSRHTGVQHLLIGIPNHSPNAVRASHFDFIDDRTAHCVSGNALSPGDYPVGVFFPHPRADDAQFQLVNLPTPRKRMAYEYSIARNESARHAAISERTLGALLAERRVLAFAELGMLRYLDHCAVSRFADRYLLAVDDEPAPPGVGFGSAHGMLCIVLAESGTQDAIPGLLQAIQRHRVTAPSADQPYNLPMIAALAIARRDSWPQAEKWLESQLDSDEQLSIAENHQSQLAATAAAVLLEQYGVAPSVFGLEQVEDDTLSAAGCPGYRFATPADRTAIVRWWAKHKEQLAARPQRTGQTGF